MPPASGQSDRYWVGRQLRPWQVHETPRRREARQERPTSVLWQRGGRMYALPHGTYHLLHALRPNATGKAGSRLPRAREQQLAFELLANYQVGQGTLTARPSRPGRPFRDRKRPPESVGERLCILNWCQPTCQADPGQHRPSRDGSVREPRIRRLRCGPGQRSPSAASTGRRPSLPRRRRRREVVGMQIRGHRRRLKLV